MGKLEMSDLALGDVEYAAKLDELDHLLNDADIDAEPDHIWTLLAEVSHHDLQGIARDQASA